MARKRRRVRRPLPKGLAELSRLEIIRWNLYGPFIRGRVSVARRIEASGYTVWESWDVWARFYEGVRDEYLARYRGKLPAAAERLYQVWLNRGDLEAEWSAIQEDLRKSDPRPAFLAQK